MMIYVAVCDDNEETAKVLEKKVLTYMKEKRTEVNLKVYTSSKMLQYDIEEGEYFDIILSDIEMPDVDGMQLAPYVKKFLPNTFIIFITSHMKYAIDAFELSIFRYIPKSNMDLRLSYALNDAIKMIEYQCENYYYIKNPGRIKKIAYQNILYIQREGKNSVITLVNEEVVKVRKSLSAVFGDLKPNVFVYIDRGIIVNLNHIFGVKNNKVELKNGIFCQQVKQN